MPKPKLIILSNAQGLMSLHISNNGNSLKDTTIERFQNLVYTRKNAQVATDLQTSCNTSVHKLLTRCIRTACSEFVRTSLEQAVDKL